MITLNAPPGTKVIELGGGARPQFHPNVDVRQCFDPQGNPTVDFTHNFDEPFGDKLKDNEWDGVYSHFAMEHISYRNVRQFIREVFRILNHGGKAAIIVPNTQAQIEWAKANPNGWDGKPAFESISCILYGDQDYSDNTHKCYLDPKIAQELFSEAGFINITVKAYGERDTDMCIEAIKPARTDNRPLVVPRPEKAEPMPFVPGFEYPSMDEKRQQDIQALMDLKTHLDNPTPNVLGTNVALLEKCGNVGPGGLVCDRNKGHDGQCSAMSQPPPVQVQPYQPELIYTEGYYNGTTPGRSIMPSGFYWDIPLFQNVANTIKALNPSHVVELGCGRGYVIRHLEEMGISAYGFDVSRHCYHTRATNNFRNLDLTKQEDLYPIGTEPADLYFSIGFWEHIPEHLVEPTIEWMSRVSRRGLHGITFAENDDGKDSTRCTLKPREWWLQRMPATHHIVPRLELFGGLVLPGEMAGIDNLIKLNLGCGQTMFHYGWKNLDFVAVQSFADAWKFQFTQCDLNDGIPYGTGEVDLIYCSHMLEHLSYDHGRKFLRDCRRVMKPGGTARFAVPDARMLADEFHNGDVNQFDYLNGDCAKADTRAAKFWWMLVEGDHKSCYDAEALIKVIRDAGFQHARQSTFRDINSHPKLRKETLDMTPTISLYVEATA